MKLRVKTKSDLSKIEVCKYIDCIILFSSELSLHLNQYMFDY